MKLLENKKEVVDFILYKNEEVLVYKDKMIIGNKQLPIKEKSSYACVNDVLYKKHISEENISTLYRFDGNLFVEEPFKYRSKKYFNLHQFSSIDSNDGVVKVSFVDEGTENLFEFTAEDKYFILTYDIPNEVLVLIEWYDESLLFYTKTGERLWEYKVEEGREIHESGVMVVDDIVVIPCTEDDAPISVEGYNLLTGEKLWEVDDEDYCNYCYVIGQNKMLYALSSYYCDGGSVELHLCELNPFTGETNEKELKEGRHWDDIHPADTVIYGNKLFYVNQIKKEGCSVGVVDLETKELIDDTPLESQGNTVEKPIVTDDKIYVRIRELNELRIYENEFK
ncbi:MAG: hypothetical protein K6E14_08895 [Paludibacteraceae bacterium]|nr:hypothetical protein [Paludibacteraceae bacterium]